MGGGEVEGLQSEVEQLRAELRLLRHERDAERVRARLVDLLERDSGRYALVLSQLAEGIVLQAADGAILSCNPAAEAILGLTADQMAGRTSMDPAWRAVHEDGAPFPGETHPAMVALRTGEPVLGVTMGVHKPDGTLTWILINARPLREPDADAPHAVLASFSDITQQREAVARAERSEGRLKFALEGAKVGAWEWRFGDDTFHMSPETERILGYTPGSAPPTITSFWSHVHPADRDAVQGAVDGAKHDPAAGDYYRARYRLQWRDGTIRHAEAFGRVERDADGEPLRMAGTIRDVSHERSLEDQLMRSQRMETVGRLAGGVAHDFNNILTAVMGWVDHLRGGRDPDGLHEGLDGIQDAAQQAGRLTSQLLTFARRRSFDLEVLDIVELTRSTERMLSRVLGDDVELSTKLASQPIFIRADRAQIEQVLINLAVNAREAMPRGGRLTLEVALRRVEPEGPEGVAPGPYALLEVSDNGEGIPTDALAQIFDPFFTTKESGTGLGLATCYGIVTQLGGTIRVDSEPGEGARFCILMPRTQSPDQPQVRATAQARGDGKGRILLVEDNDLVRATAERGLRSAGYDVVTTDSGAQALAALREAPDGFDLLLSDVVMPRMNGYELVARARALAPALPCLFVSGYAEGSYAEGDASVELRAFPHLQKPYTVGQLLSRVEALLADER